MLLQMFAVLLVAFVLVRRWSRERREEGGGLKHEKHKMWKWHKFNLSREYLSC